METKYMQLEWLKWFADELLLKGYPTITVPLGIDKDGMPVGITLQHTAWQEGTLIKWASAIEDVRNEVTDGRPLPTYQDFTAKNIPIGRKHVKS